MDENFKQLKVEAARKKLKNYQQSKNKNKIKLNDDDSCKNSHTEESSQIEVSGNVSQIQSYFSQPLPQESNTMQFFDRINVESTNFPSADQTSIDDPEIKQNEVYEYANLKSNEVENKEDDLISLYEKEKLGHSETKLQVLEQKAHIEFLQKELEKTINSWEGRINQELGPMQEQLQTHMQTVGILVSEKTELSAEVSQLQLINRQKTAECEEMQARLKTSRSRVADLEKELNIFKENKINNEQKEIKISLEQNNLFQENAKLKDAINELNQDMVELREKLRLVTEENNSLKDTNQDLSSQLNLANVRVQQLSIDATSGDTGVVEKLSMEKMELEKQVEDLNTNLRNAISDRDQASNHYQQYVQQLNLNVSSLAQKMEITIAENENLVKREAELVHHIGELEKHLQTIQNDTINYNKINLEATNKKNDNELIEKLESLKIEHDKLGEKFADVVSERDDLLKELAMGKDVISDLESEVERFKTQQGNSSALLATIESDKTAASRAVQQNNELKQQLTEMQDAFIKMTNDKADLVDKLTSEEFKTRELDDRIGILNHQLHTLTQAINIKDSELTKIREDYENINRKITKDNQLEDRLRHYEAQEHSSQVLNVQEVIDENLKELQDKLNTEVEKNKKLEEKILILQTIDGNKNDIPCTNTFTSIDNREIAMRQLESKFMNTMQEIANLEDEKQMLEHLVTQLQGETETIGEYIALYQHQRGILRQRSIEKEAQLKQLAKDRQQMKEMLNQLNELIQKFFVGKGIPGDMLEHAALSKKSEQLCQEHAEKHKKMSDQQDADTKGAAEEIMGLLTEIKTSNLVQPSDISDNFHPCPWCSGQLITV